MSETASERDDTVQMLDLAIIGAGIYGVQAARTYLQLHPKARIVVFEAADTIGGVWSSERVYDAFWTQTPLQILEFSDMKLEDVPDSDVRHGFFTAKYVSRYLEEYVATRVYNHKPLADRICVSSRVRTLTKADGHWLLDVVSSEHVRASYSQYRAHRVIDATGLTSTPNIPSISNQQSFQGLFIHHKDFGRNQEKILSSSGPSRIVVVGGAKSAADVAYASALAGKNVTWIIRRTGSGPAAFVAAKGRGLYKNSNESFYTRLTSNFLVSFFMDESKTRLGRFLYGTALGRRVIQMVWKSINTSVRALANYDRTDGKANGFHNLRPDTEIFWQNDSTGICLHDDFFDTIAKHVKVYREDVKCLYETGVELADGTRVAADAIILATGWKTSHPRFMSEYGGKDLASSLGLPTPIESQSQISISNWNELERKCTAEILGRFPILRDAPRCCQDSADGLTPLRLYKGILPVRDRTIAFVGQMMLGNHFRSAEVQALFAIAALDGTLKLPSEDEMELAIARTVSWCRLRYLSKGRAGNWIYWDLVPYTDNLLEELGLSSHRHKSFWKDLLSPCFASDLRRLIEEYSNKHGT